MTELGFCRELTPELLLSSQCFYLFLFPPFSRWKPQTQGGVTPGAPVTQLGWPGPQPSARVRGDKPKLDPNSHIAKGAGQGQD